MFAILLNKKPIAKTPDINNARSIAVQYMRDHPNI
jgi:hypothetical protein